MPISGMTDKGQVRSMNQDNYAVLKNERRVVGVVCDGVGGSKAGEVASKVAVETFQQRFDEISGRIDDVKWLEETIRLTNKNVNHLSETDEACFGMGTTLTCFMVHGLKTLIGNVGDSRCYIVDKEGNLIQITNDHTLVNDLVQNRGVDYKLAVAIVGKNVISRAIGIAEEIEVDIFEVEEEYQYILACSDGLHGYVSDQQIGEVLKGEGSAEEKCQQLIDLANKAGGLDNITVVVYQR